MHALTPFQLRLDPELIALIAGILLGAVAFPFTELGAVERLWAGALAGLGAMGLFDLGQSAKK